jgi:hypothetical protein
MAPRHTRPSALLGEQSPCYRTIFRVHLNPRDHCYIERHHNARNLGWVPFVYQVKPS